MAEAALQQRLRRIDRGIKARSDTLYAVQSPREVAFLAAPRVLLIAGVLALPLLVPNFYWQRVLCVVGVFALLAVSLDFLANYTGLICLGSAFFMGVGGYLSGILTGTLGWPVWLSMPVSAAAGGLISTLVFLPCLPLRGIYFAVVSFIYPLAASKLLVATGVLGGTDGLTDIPLLSNVWISQYTILGLALLCTFGLRRLAAEDAGVVLRGVKDNDQAIRASGISIPLCKATALYLGATIGCFAGAFMAHLYGWVGISLFAVDFSIFPITAIVVGGPGTIVGPLLGTLILVPVSEGLRSIGGLRIIFYSAVIVVFIAFWREGLLNWLRRKYEQTEFWEEV